MAINLEIELNNLARQITQLFKNEIKRQGLISSGKLINSIEFKVKKTQNGFLFNLEAVDYFTPLDDKYKISRNVFESTNYKNLITKITDVYSIYIQEQITS